MATWAREGAVEGESASLAWEYLDSRFWVGRKGAALGTAFAVCSLHS